MKMKTIKSIAYSVILLGGLFVNNLPAMAADAVCLNKPDKTACSVGDGKSAEYGKCDGKGNCVTSGVVTTPASGPGSAGQATDYKIPGTTTEESQLVKCGRPGQSMCTLCDFIAGLNNVIQYIMRISIGVGLLAFTIAGVVYVVSAGDPKTTGRAKDIMKNAAIGFVIIFAGWLIVNTVIQSLGSKTDAQGNPTFGMNITSWGQFDCSANPNR
ncbi:MAG: hypothetical protein ACD_56C00037G0007 [uncultured bacterium]|nr:MAG: hypothetical protein ACD_56C00037G0007 [uncultured bacterium]